MISNENMRQAGQQKASQCLSANEKEKRKGKIEVGEKLPFIKGRNATGQEVEKVKGWSQGKGVGIKEAVIFGITERQSRKYNLEPKNRPLYVKDKQSNTE